MSYKYTLPDKPEVKQQLSTKALQEMLRPHAVEAIQECLRLLREGDNDNVRLGAAKLLLAKVLPDLKSTDLTTEDGFKFLIQIVQDNKLKDANTDNTVADQELRSPGENIQLPSTVQDSQ